MNPTSPSASPACTYLRAILPWVPAVPAAFPLLVMGAGLIDYLLRMGRHWDSVEPVILAFYLLTLADLALVVYRANRLGPVAAASLNVLPLVLLAIGFVWCFKGESREASAGPQAWPSPHGWSTMAPSYGPPIPPARRAAWPPSATRRARW